jgi:two-component system CheB/CheR fusion protein
LIFIAYRNITNATAFIAIIVGILAATGWYFHIPALTSLLPDAIPVRLNAALCFFLSGTALYLLNTKPSAPIQKKIIILSGWFILLTGLFTFFEFISGLNFGIDDLLYKPDPLAEPMAFNGRMSLPAAIQFVLLGCCFLLLPHRRLHLFIDTVIILVILSSLLTLLNYLSGSVYFQHLLQFYSTSPSAALVFIALCAGIHYSHHMDYRPRNFKKKIAAYFVLVFLVLGFFFLAMKKNNDTVSGIARQVDNTDEIISLTETIHTDVEMMQNNIKNFLLLKNVELLGEYEKTVQRIDGKLDSLRFISTGNTAVQWRCDSMKNILARYNNSRKEIISRHLQKNMTGEELRTAVLDGKARVDQFRSLLFFIKDAEKRNLPELKKEKYRYLQKSPRIITLSQVFTILFLLAALWMIYSNLHSRDKAETALDKSEKFLKAIINNSTNPIAIRDTNGKYLLANGSVEKMTGYSKEQLIGKSIWELYPQATADATKAADDEVVRTRDIVTQEVTWGVNGEALSFAINRFPLFDEQNNIYAIGTLATDISALKKAQELQEEFMHFFRNSNDLCVISGIGGEFENINPTTLTTLGYSEKEMLGKSFIDFVHPDDILFVLKEVEKSRTLLAEAINFSRRFQKKDGGYIWINWKATPDTLTQKIYAIGRDITEEKILETKLKQFNMELERQVDEKTKLVLEKEHQYRFLLENMREGIQVIGYDWRYLFVNNSVVDQSQYADEKELLGHTMMEKYPGIENTELFSILERCMTERRPDTVENFFLFPNGDKGWFELSIQPVPEGIFILSIDITDRKKAEEKLNNYTEELKRSNTELERFAYVASHDLQEPLRMVSSFMNLLSRRLEDQLDDTAKQYMHYAVDGADRMKSLIHDLLEYSRVGTNKENFVKTDPAEVINYVIRVLDEEIQKTGAQISIGPMPLIMANKTLFSQLLVNLVSNALKYNGNKVPQIELGCTENAHEYKFYVKDNGEGIDQKFFDKIFIIFQRLHNKGEYSGTGIGLAICKKIVEAHKGRIWVESEKGIGSTFYFTIPKSVI